MSTAVSLMVFATRAEPYDSALEFRIDNRNHVGHCCSGAPDRRQMVLGFQPGCSDLDLLRWCIANTDSSRARLVDRDRSLEIPLLHGRVAGKVGLSTAPLFGCI